MYFPNPEDRQAKELVPGIMARTFWGEQMLMALVEIAPDAVLPRHSHPHEQAGIVLDGELEFTIGDETKVLRAGDVYLIPGNVEHSAKPRGGPARVVDIFSPVREEYKFP